MGVQWETPHMGSFAQKNLETPPCYNFFFLNNNNNSPTCLHNFLTWVLYLKNCLNCLHNYQPQARHALEYGVSTIYNITIYCYMTFVYSSLQNLPHHAHYIYIYIFMKLMIGENDNGMGKQLVYMNYLILFLL
jgi:hypothetical protein